MSEVVVVSAPAPQMQESTLDKVIRYFIILVTIAILVGIGLALYFFVTNWDWVITSLTTGFIGFLNPFDDPEGDSILGVSTDPSGGFFTTGGLVGAVLNPVGTIVGWFSGD